MSYNYTTGYGKKKCMALYITDCILFVRFSRTFHNEITLYERK